MGRWLGALLLLSACVMWSASVTAGQGGGGRGAGGGQEGGGPGGGERQPGGPGGFGALLAPPPGMVLDFILQHDGDLNLTAEQKAKLEELKKNLPPPPEKPPAPDAELKELFKKMREAMKNGDTETAKALRQQIAEKLKQANPEAGKTMEAIKAVLTPEQLEKFRELWRSTAKGGEGRGQGGQGGGNQGGQRGGSRGGGGPAGASPCPF